MASLATPARHATTPNQTLYVTNVTDKLRKTDLRLSLYALFSTHGVVLDVVAMPGNKARGQAWIAFRDYQQATQAMRSLQGFEFFGKSLVIQYAKGKSHAIAKLDGSYRPAAAVQLTSAATSVQQQVFGEPSAAGVVSTHTGDNQAKVSAEADTQKGQKRSREVDSEDEEAVAMEEESDASMEEASDDE